MTFYNSHKRRGGFTLAEIMIVVAIITLLTAIAVPNWLRSRKRTQATLILDDLRALDHAVDQYALEHSKSTGVNPSFGDIQPYVKSGTVLYNTGADLFGDSYGPFTVDSSVQVPPAAYQDLSDVAPAPFWMPYLASTGT